jgi:hypothetical protein
VNWELLLHWMTHVGEGTWGAFRASVTKLAGSDAEVDSMCRRLRVTLSDMGHADFFVAGSQRWRILPPVLAGLAGEQAVDAVLAGARTRILVDRLIGAAASQGCIIETEDMEAAPSIVRVHGDRNALAETARAAGIDYLPNVADAFCMSATAVPALVRDARPEEGPANWAVRSFDLRSLKWIEGLHDRSACEYQSRYGPRKFFLHRRRGQLLRLPKRDAVYAAAMLNGVTLPLYDEGLEMLSTPIAAPLPEALSRAAALCGGAPAKMENGRLRYGRVPPQTAALILLSAGAAYPRGTESIRATTTDRPGNGQPI